MPLCYSIYIAETFLNEKEVAVLRKHPQRLSVRGWVNDLTESGWNANDMVPGLDNIDFTEVDNYVAETLKLINQHKDALPPAIYQELFNRVKCMDDISRRTLVWSANMFYETGLADGMHLGVYHNAVGNQLPQPSTLIGTFFGIPATKDDQQPEKISIPAPLSSKVTPEAVNREIEKRVDQTLESLVQALAPSKDQTERNLAWSLSGASVRKYEIESLSRTKRILTVIQPDQARAAMLYDFATHTNLTPTLAQRVATPHYRVDRILVLTRKEDGSGLRYVYDSNERSTDEDTTQTTSVAQ